MGQHIKPLHLQNEANTTWSWYISAAIIKHIKTCTKRIQKEEGTDTKNKIYKIISNQSLANNYLQNTHRKQTPKRRYKTTTTPIKHDGNITYEDTQHRELYDAVFTNIHQSYFQPHTNKTNIPI